MWMLETIYLVGHSDVRQLCEQLGKMLAEGVDVDRLVLTLNGLSEIHLGTVYVTFKVAQLVEFR